MDWAAGRNAGLFATLSAAALLQPVACNGPDETPALSDAAMELALAPVGAAIVGELDQLQADLDALDTTLEAWQVGLTSGDGTAEQAEAQAAFLGAMTTFQRLEVLQIGPAGNSLSAIGGEDLRDEMYSWPDTVSGCRVDTETVEEVWDAPDFFTSNLVNSYGLDAVEHLLFAPLDTECPSQVGIDADWTALGEAGVRANRADYARALVAHLSTQATDLATRWDTELGEALVAGSAPWSTRSEALGAVYDALFYLETGTKDRKLAEPMGLRDCTVDCLALVESPLSGGSVAWVAENLRSAHHIVLASESDGLDALLVEVGHGDLATALDSGLATAIATADGLADQPLDTLVVDDPEAAQRLFDDVKVVTDLLRGDVATVLLLEIPSEAAGDND